MSWAGSAVVRRYWPRAQSFSYEEKLVLETHIAWGGSIAGKSVLYAWNLPSHCGVEGPPENRSNRTFIGLPKKVYHVSCLLEYSSLKP